MYNSIIQGGRGSYADDNYIHKLINIFENGKEDPLIHHSPIDSNEIKKKKGESGSLPVTSLEHTIKYKKKKESLHFSPDNWYYRFQGSESISRACCKWTTRKEPSSPYIFLLKFIWHTHSWSMLYTFRYCVYYFFLLNSFALCNIWEWPIIGASPFLDARLITATPMST